MNENGRKAIKGVRIRTFNACMIVLSCAVFFCLIYNTVRMPAQYHQLIIHTDEYMTCEEDASSLSAASDYLTEQVQYYTQNMDMKYMERYFEEVRVTHRREKALEDLESHETTDEAYDALQSALQCSNDLMNREIYAMKLISLANGYPEESLPEEVREINLKVSDAQLTPEEMIEKARTMVFDTGYQDAKALIRSHLDHFLESIIGNMANQQDDSEVELGHSISRQ